MEHYFFSYLLTFEVNLIDILESMGQMGPYIIFKPQTNKADYRLILNCLKKVIGGVTTQKYQKQIQKP